MNDPPILKKIIFKDDLEIHLCDPITLEAIKILYFKTLDELEKYIYTV